MKSFSKSALSLSAFSMSALMLTACSGGSTSSQFLKNVSLAVSTQNNDSYLNLTSTFDLGGNVSLAEMDVTIVDPANQIPRGNVHFSQLPNGQGQITVGVNATLIAHADQALGQVLPNGKPLPLALGAHAGDVLGVKILEHSTVYLGGDTKTTAYAGVALGIVGFDQVMNQLQTAANVFFMGNFSNNVLGVGGIYGSSTPNESGIAIFGKYTANAAKNTPVSALDQNTDYEIEKLNARTLYRLQKFFSKKRTLQFH